MHARPGLEFACLLLLVLVDPVSTVLAQTDNAIYVEDFELDDGGYRWVEEPEFISGTLEGSTVPWVWGSPMGDFLTAAPQGARCWFSDFEDLPLEAGKTRLQSPTIDLTQVTQDPVLQFKHAFSTPLGTYRLQVSISGGPYQTLGVPAAPGALNWYSFDDNTSWGFNSKVVNTSPPYWITSRHVLVGCAGKKVRLRWIGNWNGSWESIFTDYEGWSLDDVRIEPTLTDLALIQIEPPEPRGDLGVEGLGFTAENIGLAHISSADMQLEVEGPIAGQVTVNVPINLAPGESGSFFVPDVWDFGAEGIYLLRATLSAPGDILEDNDTFEDLTIHLETVDRFPYECDFESGPGPFASTSSTSSWEWGAPAGPYIGTAASGVFAWVTNLDGNIEELERSYLWTPEFDFTHAEGQYWLEFEHIFQLFFSSISRVEISLDNGPFEELGNFGSPGSLNWYNSNEYPPAGAWNFTLGTPGVWNLARHILPEVVGHRVRVRILLDDQEPIPSFGTTGEGVGIDDFAVRPIEFGVGQTALPGLSQLNAGAFLENEFGSPSGDLYGFPPNFGFPGPFFANTTNGLSLSVQSAPNQVIAVFFGDLAPANLNLPGIGLVDLVNFELLAFGALTGGLNPFFVTDADGLFELSLSSSVLGAKPVAFQGVTIQPDGTARLTNTVQVTFDPF